MTCLFTKHAGSSIRIYPFPCVLRTTRRKMSRFGADKARSKWERIFWIHRFLTSRKVVSSTPTSVRNGLLDVYMAYYRKDVPVTNTDTGFCIVAITSSCFIPTTVVWCKFIMCFGTFFDRMPLLPTPEAGHVCFSIHNTIQPPLL